MFFDGLVPSPPRVSPSPLSTRGPSTRRTSIERLIDTVPVFFFQILKHDTAIWRILCSNKKKQLFYCYTWNSHNETCMVCWIIKLSLGEGARFVESSNYHLQLVYSSLNHQFILNEISIVHQIVNSEKFIVIN